MTTAPTAPTDRPLNDAVPPAARAPQPAGSGLPAITLPPANAPAETTPPSAPAQGDAPAPRSAFTRLQKLLIAIVVVGVIAIAGIGFAGSYSAVTAQAEVKGFGWFAHWITLGVDCGIGVFLALDLLLTWLDMPYPALRPGAWFLTAATITFNASLSWPDPIGVGMHATIPVLFVLAVEAARHAIARTTQIAADTHTQTPPIKRWILAPWPTFRLWRRQTIWDIRSYTTVLALEKERIEYRQMLRSTLGLGWRRKAHPADILALRFARHGVPITVALQRAETELDAIAQRHAQRNATPPAVSRNAIPPVAPASGATHETPRETAPATPTDTAVAQHETAPQQRETPRTPRRETTPRPRNTTPDKPRETAPATPLDRTAQLAIVGPFVDQWNGPDEKLPLQPIADALGRSKPTASRLVREYRETKTA